jgi:chromate reductase, NAD(P)H dehydrogenase (quinone)
VLDLAASALPERVSYQYADFSVLPLFNEDIENPLPENVVQFKQIVESADALLISTPMYNNTITGAVKNTIDWLSRSMGNN